MTDPAKPPQPLVKITMEDALTLRNELREMNKGMGKILGRILSMPFSDKESGEAKTFDESINESNALIDRLTIAIHEAGK